MLGNFALPVKAHMPSHRWEYAHVKHDAARALAENLRALMNATPDLNSQPKVGKRSKIDQRTVGRILNCENSPTLKQIDALAEAFGLLPWQLLVPNLDPANVPAVSLTQDERELYQRLSLAAETLAKYRK